MHKTGSTSIQAALAKWKDPAGWRYLNVDGHKNMNQAAFLMFDKQPRRNGMLAKRGLDDEQLSKLREVLRGRLSDELACMGGGTKAIISAEMISSIDADGIREMQCFLAPWFDEIKILGYVRPPVSFINSIFQEQVKHGRGSLRELAVPHYRSRFEKFDNVFGVENVILRRFNSNSFPNGCIVADFCDQTGLPTPDPALTERVNESLSREACGILYAYRKHGPGYGVGRNAIRENNQIIRPLLAMRGTRFQFSREIMDLLVDKIRDDISWMENRLGEGLSEPPRDEGPNVGSEEDLLLISRASCVEFVTQFETLNNVGIPSTAIPADDPVSPLRVTELVESCRKAARASKRKKQRRIRNARRIRRDANRARTRAEPESRRNPIFMMIRSWFRRGTRSGRTKG